jgi:hypothetical protein
LFAVLLPVYVGQQTVRVSTKPNQRSIGLLCPWYGLACWISIPSAGEDAARVLAQLDVHLARRQRSFFVRPLRS